MNAQRKPLLIVLGILLVGAGIGLNIMLPRILGTDTSANGPTGPSGGTGPVVQTKPVVVTSAPVAAGAKLVAPTNIAVVQYPATLVPVGAFATTDAIGEKYAALQLAPNTPLTPELLVGQPKPPGPAVPAPDIPPGSVLFTVPYDSGTMGYFQQGDHLDVLVADAGGTTSYPLTNLVVARLGNPDEITAALKPTQMILVVTRAQALQLGSLLSGKGGTTIQRWVIRSPKDA